MRRFFRLAGIGALAIVSMGQATRPQPPARLTVPDPAAQARAQQMIRSLFKNDYAKKAPADKAALARTLLGQAAGTSDDLAARYELFLEAADLSGQAGDGEMAVKAILQLATLYQVNAVALQTHALITAGTVCTPENADKVAEAALTVAFDAATLDDFASVVQLTAVAEAAANRTKRVAYVAGVQPRIADLRALSLEYDRARKALALLKTSPDDAAAHLVVGTFYGLHKGAWDVALPHLARGSDSELAALAAKELDAPSQSADQVAIGDAWWDLAGKDSGLARTMMTRHAQDWYRRAQTSIKGITLTRIEARLGDSVAPSMTSPPPGPGQPLAQPALGASGGRFDLAALIDPAKDTVSGAWRPAPGGGVSVGVDRYSVLELPCSLPDEYDLQVAFTRTAGDGSLAIFLSSHKKRFDLALDVKGEARFERVDNKINKDNPTTVPVTITTGKKYVITVEVRKDHVRALLDGTPLTEWKTDYKDLARYAVWKVADENLCGLGANNAAVTFHSAQLVEVSGKGKPTR